MDDLERDFIEIVKALYKRKQLVLCRDKEYLKAVAIASWVKQNSNRCLFDKSMVSNVVGQYKYYFDSRRVNKFAYEFAVKWELIYQDHPHLIPENTKPISPAVSSIATNDKVNPDQFTEKPEHQRRYVQKRERVLSWESFCLEARQALTDEYKQAEEILLSHPVIVRGFQQIEENLDTEAALIFEAELEYLIDEAPPIPEGVPVRVRWQYSGGTMKAKLLQWDLLNNKAYLAFERPLDNQQQNNQSRIELTTHELIRPLQENLDQIKALDELIAWRLLSQANPQQIIVGHEQLNGPLDYSQERAVKKAIEYDYTIIWGPPGTGKTHTIGCLICELVSAGKRVLATSISNIAVDNMAIKFVQNMKSDYTVLNEAFESSLFLRFGYTKNEELSKDEYRPLFSIQSKMSTLLHDIRQIKDQKARIGNEIPKEAALLSDKLDKMEKERIEKTKQMVTQASVVFTTAAQVYINSAFEALKNYDVVIVDEVSMMSIPTFSVVAARSSTQTVVVGDFRQLAPIAVSRSEKSQEYLHQSPFEWLKLPDKPIHPAMEMLSNQRRMDPSISQWISKQFYDSELKDDPVVRDYIITLPSELPARLVLWDMSRTRHKTTSYKTEFSKSKSRYNLGSAACVVKLALFFKKTNPAASIAVISTYREQTHQLRIELETSCGDRSTDIQVGTVHTFQGSEADIVIWDMVDTYECGFGLPYRGDQGDRLTNVAISRAKKLMVVACDRRLITKKKTQVTVNKAIKLLREVVSCEDIIDGWLVE